MFNQLFRTPGKQVPGKPLASSKQKQSDKENARPFGFAGRKRKELFQVDEERLMKTPEDWAKEQAEGLASQRRAFEILQAMLKA